MHRDARLAAAEAGYVRPGIAWQLVRHPGIQEELQRHLDGDSEILSAPEIMRELSILARDSEQASASRVRALELLGRRLGLWEAWQYRRGVPPQVMTGEELDLYGEYLDTLTIATNRPERV